MFLSRKFTVACTLAFLFSVFPNFHASPSEYEEENILSPKGEPIFQARFYQSGEAQFSKSEKQAISDGLAYWARILIKGLNGVPAIIDVKKRDLHNFSVLARYHYNNPSLFQALEEGHKPYENGIHGFIEINSNIDYKDEIEKLHKVIIHELGHGLLPDMSKKDGTNVREVLKTNGGEAALSQVPTDGFHISLARSIMNPSYFDENYRFFIEVELAFLQDQGWHIDRRNFFGSSFYQNGQEFTNYNGYFARNADGTAYIQEYNKTPEGIGLHIYGSKNRVTQKGDILTEGHRAVGVLIDGEENRLALAEGTKIHAHGSRGVGVLFPFSKNQSLTLNASAEISAEAEGGIGVHLGGEKNTISLAEKASIYANGPDGIGLHMHGQENRLALAENAKIYAHGPRGVGVLVSDGRDNRLTLTGSIEAQGEGGKGLSFEFGKNNLDLRGRKRGSYLEFEVREGGKTESIGKLPPEVNGPLAREVVIDGSLVGKDKALFMDAMAYVKSITITPKATVDGHIISYYDSFDSYTSASKKSWPYLVTSLVFGPKDGESIPEQRPFIYRHNIQGRNLAAEFKNPYATALYKGTHKLHSATVAPDALLAGNSFFSLGKEEDRVSQPYYGLAENPQGRGGGTFTNAGIVSPSSEDSSIGIMVIDGTFEQKGTGTLVIDVAPDGSSDLLGISGRAILDGTLKIQPLPGHYPTDWKAKSPFLVADEGIEKDFSSFTLPQSPTLKWKWGRNEQNRYYGVCSLSQSRDRCRFSQIPTYSELKRVQQSHWQPKEKAEPAVEPKANKDEQALGGLSGESEEIFPEPTPEKGEEKKGESITKVDLTADEDAQTQEGLSGESGEIFPEPTPEKGEEKKDEGVPEGSPTADEDEQALSGISGESGEIFPEPTREKDEEKKDEGVPNVEPGKEKEEDKPDGYRQVQDQSEESTQVLKAMRAPDAYSQYGESANERAVGQVLDRLVDVAGKALQDLYTALDFSAPDGSEVRSVLGQLSPVAYSGFFSASLNREYVITDTLNARPSTPTAPVGSWYGFVLPFASQVEEKSIGKQVGYSNRSSGVVFGVEQDASSLRGLTWGVHGVVGQKGSMSFKTADNAHGTLQAWGLGVQMRYQPNLREGLDVAAHVRLGLEQGSMTRSLAFASYHGEQQAKWLGWTSSLAVSGAYLWALNPIVSFGPLVGMEYVTLSRPSLMERGSQGLNFALDPISFDSLRSSFGLRGVVFMSEKLKIDLQARWDRELLSVKVNQGVAFLGYDEAFFFAESVSAPRQDMYVSSQATYDVNSKVSIGARVAVQFARFAKPEFSGNLAFKMRF